MLAAAAVCAAAIGLAFNPAFAADKNKVGRDQNKEFDQLTPSEHIAIRAAAKAAYKGKKLRVLNVCADPGNMPLSNIKMEGFQNKLAKLLANSMGARLNYHWQPFIERGLTRSTFDEKLCDVMFDIPANYGRLLTTLTRSTRRPTSSFTATTRASTLRVSTIRSSRTSRSAYSRPPASAWRSPSAAS